MYRKTSISCDSEVFGKLRKCQVFGVFGVFGSFRNFFFSSSEKLTFHSSPTPIYFFRNSPKKCFTLCSISSNGGIVMEDTHLPRNDQSDWNLVDSDRDLDPFSSLDIVSRIGENKGVLMFHTYREDLWSKIIILWNHANVSRHEEQIYNSESRLSRFPWTLLKTYDVYA